jgi:hypothetical protein
LADSPAHDVGTIARPGWHNYLDGLGWKWLRVRLHGHQASCDGHKNRHGQ